MFDDPKSPYFSFVNDLLSFTTILSILSVVLETVHSFSPYEKVFLAIEWGAVILFSMEYVFRFWSTKRSRDYALSLFGIIDLVAILPTILGLGNLSFLKSARVVRIIRFLRVARISKLSRSSMKDAEETLGVFGLNIALYAATLVFIMLILGASLHIFINGDGVYWSIPAGMYWAFSVFLGGLPTPIPTGTTGTAIFILAKFFGMVLFGLLIGIISKMFNQWILGKK